MSENKEKTDYSSHPGIRRYTLPQGWTILVGKSDADNDYLTFKLAGSNDWWFHVRGITGSHAVLKAKPDSEPDVHVLKQAAAVAAYHSKVRAGGTVAVACTRIQNVTKPKGAKPGTVIIRKEKILKVRPALPETHESS